MVLRGNRVEEFDFESANRRQLRGNIYLAKVTRVEPSLQAAFVDYGGNRHGFLAFSEIHPDYYQIPVADRQALIAEEERAHRDAEDEIDRRASARPRRTAARRAAHSRRRDAQRSRSRARRATNGDATASIRRAMHASAPRRASNHGHARGTTRRAGRACAGRAEAAAPQPRPCSTPSRSRRADAPPSAAGSPSRQPARRARRARQAPQPPRTDSRPRTDSPRPRAEGDNGDSGKGGGNVIEIEEPAHGRERRRGNRRVGRRRRRDGRSAGAHAALPPLLQDPGSHQAPADHAGAGGEGRARHQGRGADDLPLARRPLFGADAEHRARRRHLAQDHQRASTARSSRKSRRTSKCRKAWA